MQSELVYSYNAFRESMNSNTYEHLKDYHIDINKSRKNIMYYSQYDYPVWIYIMVLVFNLSKVKTIFLYVVMAGIISPWSINIIV